MPKKKIVGPCHICGNVTSLSYEHVPPRAAFNDSPVWVLRGDIALRADPDNLPRGTQQQRGAGEYTLCGQCNNNTGAWYGRAFADFTWQAADVLLRTGGNASLYYRFHIFPLRVLKQIACMFMSTNGPGFATVHQELVRFVLNPRAVGLALKYRFYVYYNAGDKARFAGATGILNTTTRTVRVVSELSFPPLGYVLSLSGPPPDGRLLDISGFARYLYDDLRELSLRIPVLPVFTSFPGDYRDRETVRRHVERNGEDDGA